MTIIELLIAVGIAVIILSVVLGLIISSHNLYDTDRARVQTLQNLRSNLDIMGADIRKAGVGLPATFPALLIADGGSGTDTLTVRQSLIEKTLILTTCVQDTLIVYDLNGPNPNCNLFIDVDPADGFPDILKEWQDIRMDTNSNILRAYIDSPTNNQGEFFDINNELDLGGGQFGLDGNIAGSYPPGARIYVIEERKYQLVSDVLEMIVNEVDTFEASFGITDLQFQVGLQGNITTNNFGVTDNWKTIDWIDVTLTAQNSNGEGSVRTLSSRLLPRNVISDN